MSDTALRSALFARLAALLPEFAVDAVAATEGASLAGDLGLDSLDTLELVMRAEDELNIEVSDEDADGCDTFGKLVDAVFKTLYGRVPA